MNQRELLDKIILELEDATPGDHDSYVTAVAGALFYARELAGELENDQD